MPAAPHLHAVLPLLQCPPRGARVSGRLGEGEEEEEESVLIARPAARRAARATLAAHGFDVVWERLGRRVGSDQAASLYEQHAGKPSLPRLVEHVTSGPVDVLIVRKRNAVADLRGLLAAAGALHASDSHASAAREIGLCCRWF